MVKEAETAQSLVDQQTEDSEAKQANIKKLTQDLIEGALNTQSSVVYNGNDVDVKEIDNEGTEEIRKQNKEAIKAALQELKADDAQANTSNASLAAVAHSNATNATGLAALRDAPVNSTNATALAHQTSQNTSNASN